MIRLSTIALATVLVASASSAISTSAMAQSRIEVGVLECRGSTTSFIVGSVTDLSCAFRPANGGQPKPYNATLPPAVDRQLLSEGVFEKIVKSRKPSR